MGNIVIILVFAAAVFVFGGVVERARLRRFWSRACTGSQWRRRFPGASKAELREFLDLFLDAFAFSESRRLCFAPDDRIMDVYRALYPFPKVTADSMELESFIIAVRERYGVDLLPHWRDHITLGDLYERTRARTA